MNLLVVDERNKGVPVGHYLIAPSAEDAHGERRGGASYNADLLEAFTSKLQDAVTERHRQQKHPAACQCDSKFLPKV